MYLLWLIPEFYIRRGEDSLALQSRERRGEKRERERERRAERNSQANRGRQQSGENKRQRHSTGSLMKGLCIGSGEQTEQECTSANIFIRSGRSFATLFFLFISFFFLPPVPLCVTTQNSAPDPFIFFLFLYFFWSSSDGAPSHRELNATGSLTHNKPPTTREGERALIQVGLSPKGNQVFIISFFNLHPL